MKQNFGINRTQFAGDDSIIIKKFFKGLEGGRALFVPEDSKVSEGGVTTEIVYPEVLRAGMPIIKTTATVEGVASTPVYAPCGLKVVTSAEGLKTTSLNIEGAQIVGILQASILKSKASAAIMTWGIVNPSVEGTYLTAEAQAAIKAALPHIDFQSDEIA